MYQVTQHNADTRETFIATGDTLEAAVRAAVAAGQASTQHGARVGVITAALQETGTAVRGFARYTVQVIPGDPEPETTTHSNLTLMAFGRARKVHRSNGTGTAPMCQPYGGSGSRDNSGSRWVATDRDVDCRACQS